MCRKEAYVPYYIEINVFFWIIWRTLHWLFKINTLRGDLSMYLRAVSSSSRPMRGCRHVMSGTNEGSPGRQNALHSKHRNVRLEHGWQKERVYFQRLLKNKKQKGQTRLHFDVFCSLPREVKKNQPKVKTFYFEALIYFHNWENTTKKRKKEKTHYFCARNITNSYFLKRHSGCFRVI